MHKTRYSLNLEFRDIAAQLDSIAEVLEGSHTASCNNSR